MGYANARFNMELEYVFGIGFMQDSAYVHIVATSSGDDFVPKNRDMIVKQMPPLKSQRHSKLPENVSVRNTKGVE